MNSVIFDTIDSYDDLGLWLTDVQFGSAQPWRWTAEVPGKNGKTELTQRITDRITYRNVVHTLTFAAKKGQQDWETIRNTVNKALHGRFMDVVIQPDTQWHWQSFVTVDPFGPDRNLGTFKILLDAYPYKLKNVLTQKTLTAGDNTLQNEEMPVVPTFVVTGGQVNIGFGEKSYAFGTGTHKDAGIILDAGNNIMTKSGSGTVNVSYREGRL